MDEVGPDSPCSLELDDNTVDDNQQLQLQELEKVNDNSEDSLSTAATSTTTQAATTTTTTTSTTISAVQSSLLPHLIYS